MQWFARQSSSCHLDSAGRRYPLFGTLGMDQKEFTKAYLAAGGNEQALSGSRIGKGGAVYNAGFGNMSFGTRKPHYARHFDYIHYNPVKHGYVESVQDWPYSTFHRWVKQGVYPGDWAVRPMGSWRSMIWILLLWNGAVHGDSLRAFVKVRRASLYVNCIHCENLPNITHGL